MSTCVWPAGTFSRDEIIEAADSYDMVEAYPDDKYLPSYLLRGVQPEARSTCFSRLMSAATTFGS